MLPIQIALISQTSQVPMSEVNIIAAALQKQVTRDFTPIWNIPANVSAFSKLEDVPLGYYPIIIKDNIGQPNAAGLHSDRSGQPYALVQASSETPLTCSHECLEMLVDPFGNRMVAALSIKQGQGRVKYLVEVCDPCEDTDFSYSINGVRVSDFYTPNYFDPIKNPHVRYSFVGAIAHPREVLKGGYLSWQVPETGEWWQATFFKTKIVFKNLGVLSRANGKSWREIIDAMTFEPVQKTLLVVRIVDEVYVLRA
jgi:hypothetical protein